MRDLQTHMGRRTGKSTERSGSYEEEDEEGKMREAEEKKSFLPFLLVRKFAGME